jgi:hypothetical protein
MNGRYWDYFSTKKPWDAMVIQIEKINYVLLHVLEGSVLGAFAVLNV